MLIFTNQFRVKLIDNEHKLCLFVSGAVFEDVFIRMFNTNIAYSFHFNVFNNLLHVLSILNIYNVYMHTGAYLS